MKAIYRLTCLISTLFLITSCSQFFTYKEACWQGGSVPGQCGHCITHPCETNCETCKGYGEDCKACWTCIKHNACMQ